MIYDPVAKTQIHATVPCPKTASKQRAGRAGRTIPGINIKLITQQEWDNLPDTEPPQPQLEDPIPIFLRLMRHSTTEVRNRVLDQLGIEQGLRAYAMEHLWVNNMVTTEGELTKLGRFAADMEPNDPENAALLWYGHQFNVLREATIIYVLVTRGGSLVNPKVKSLYPHPDGDFHTMVNIWNAAEWTHHQTKHLDPKKRNDEQILIKIWGRLGTSRRSYMILKEHLARTAEKCCKLLGTLTDRVIGPPRTDRLAAARLSLALFKSYKCSLMVKELAGHYSSVTEPDEWRIGTTSAMTFNPSLIITAQKTVRILGINSTAAYAPEKLLDTVMPVPEELILTELWFCRNLGRSPAFQKIRNRIQSTVVYANMAMVHRLCPALALTPISTNQVTGTGLLKTEAGALELMQSTQWIYERGMHELQETAIENLYDIPIQVDTWVWSDTSSFPVATCRATYLSFPLSNSDKGSDRPVRENSSLNSYRKCVVMPYHDSGQWRRVRPISVPETVSYKARRAQDGEMEVGEGDGQPDYKDSTERMQDLAEEEAGEGESASQSTIGGARPISFSAFKSKFEPYEKGGLVMKRDVYDELQAYECPLCKTFFPEGTELDVFHSLQQLSDHVKDIHDVVFYSSTTYSCQQVLCGRQVKAARVWLNKTNETFGRSGPPKERKIKRHNQGGASDPFLDTPFVPLTTNPTPTPPRLTAERVERGPIVRPEYPTTSMAVNDISGYPLVKMSAALCVQSWSLQASQGLLSEETTGIMRQIDPIYSPVDLFPAPSGETPVGWFTPYDAKMIIRLTGNKEVEAGQKTVFSLFMAAIQLIRESRLRPRLMDSVFNFTNIGIMISPVPMRQILKDEYHPESELYSEEEWEYPIAIHGMVSGAEEERTRAQEWQELFGKYKAPAFPLPNDRVFHLQSDDAACDEGTITAETSGLNDLGTPVPQIIQQFCYAGLSQQAVTQDHPLDNSQTEAHQVYDELVRKNRDAVRVVREHLNSKKSWVELMKLSVIDDGPEVAVDVHLGQSSCPGLIYQNKDQEPSC